MELFIKGRMFILLLLLVAANCLFAGTTGKIAGTVKDKNTGEALIGADVVLEGTGMGSSTDADGFFAILNVPPGTYTLTVHYVGYAAHSYENIRVNIDRTSTQHVQLSPEAIEGETVVVEARRPAIEIDRTHSASIISAETVELMPVTEVEEVIALQAGVVNSGGQLHFRGGRAREVTYIIDGVPVTNSFSEEGGSLVQVQNNMIEELEVISGTFSAEYGQAQSGVVNIVTKNPASKFAANLEVYAGEWVSNKDHILLGVNNINPLSDKNLNFSFTGPIFSNKLGFVLTGRLRSYESLDWYERRFNTLDGWRIAAYRDWAQKRNIATGGGTGIIPIPDSLATGDHSRGPLRTSDFGSLQAKLIYSPSSKITLSYQGFGSYEETVGPLDPLGNGFDQFFKYAPDDFGTFQEWSYSHFFRFQHVPSDKFFYNLAASYQREDGDFFYRKDNKISRFPGDDGIQLFSATGAEGAFSLGGTTFFYTNAPGQNYIDQYLVQGDFNWQIDRYNYIKAGFSGRQIIADIYGRGFRSTPAWQNYAWPLTSEIDPAQLTYEEYWTALTEYWMIWEDSIQAERYLPVRDDEVAFYRDFQVKPREFSAYLQDKLELGDIIINGGLRLDMVDPNDYVPINYRTESFNLGASANLKKTSVKHQFSPRLGISFPISSRGAFHGSYGHFFQMPPYERMFNGPLVVLTRFQLEGRTLGIADLKAEKTNAYEIGLQQAITDEIAVDVTAYYKDFQNLLGVEQIQTIDLVTYRRFINRDYGNSKGITVDFTKRDGFVNGGINYTLSFANGSASDPAALFLITTATQVGGEDNVFPERKIRSLNWDQRHTVNAFINFVKPNNWSLGLVGFLNSGNPFSPVFVDRFDVPEREYLNAAYKPTRWNIDLKAMKHFKIAGIASSLFLKVNNLFDQLNHERVYVTTGRADQIARLPEETARLQENLATEGLFTLDEIEVVPDNFSLPRLIQIGFEVKFQ
jgi:outer membrane receptor protein involved in Fe transport